MNTPEALAQFEAAVADPRFSHTRARSFQRAYLLTVYWRDPESPTGVCGAPAQHIVWDDPETDEILYKHGRTSPLSPTEGR